MKSALSALFPVLFLAGASSAEPICVLSSSSLDRVFHYDAAIGPEQLERLHAKGIVLKSENARLPENVRAITVHFFENEELLSKKEWFQYHRGFEFRRNRLRWESTLVFRAYGLHSGGGPSYFWNKAVPRCDREVRWVSRGVGDGADRRFPKRWENSDEAHGIAHMDCLIEEFPSCAEIIEGTCRDSCDNR